MPRPGDARTRVRDCCDEIIIMAPDTQTSVWALLHRAATVRATGWGNAHDHADHPCPTSLQQLEKGRPAIAGRGPCGRARGGIAIPQLERPPKPAQTRPRIAWRSNAICMFSTAAGMRSRLDLRVTFRRPRQRGELRLATRLRGAADEAVRQRVWARYGRGRTRESRVRSG